MKKVSIIDYGMSNLLSICRAFEHVGAEVKVVTTPTELESTDYLVLPGVGAFPEGMRELHARRFPDAIKRYVETERPFLGICLGMQMLLTTGTEHKETEGLGIIEGKVLPLPKNMPAFKVPNINWHSVYETPQNAWTSGIFKDTPQAACFYFVHSYYAAPEHASNILAESRFGDLPFAAALIKNNVTGTQFHPEKSGEEGLKMLKNFLLL